MTIGDGEETGSTAGEDATAGVSNLSQDKNQHV
jgi:hypothetical protein